MSNQIESSSAQIGPSDDRCRWWSKVVRNGATLPAPSDIVDASNIEGPFLKKGEKELVPGDFVIHGEEVHHRHNRGWTYQIGYMTAQGDTEWVTPTSEHKKSLKEAGMATDLLKGSGELAACARLVHGLRAGLDAGIPAMATGPVSLSRGDSSEADAFMASLEAMNASASLEASAEAGQVVEIQGMQS